jgi:hypothetical protein
MPAIRGPESGHQEISYSLLWQVARQCPVLLAGINFPDFSDTGVGYPRSGHDQWPAVIPSQYLKSTEAGLCRFRLVRDDHWLMAAFERGPAAGARPGRPGPDHSHHILTTAHVRHQPGLHALPNRDIDAPSMWCEQHGCSINAVSRAMRSYPGDILAGTRPLRAPPAPRLTAGSYPVSGISSAPRRAACSLVRLPRHQKNTPMTTKQSTGSSSVHRKVSRSPAPQPSGRKSAPNQW